MGIKNLINKAGVKAADKIAKLSALSPEQLNDIQNKKETYLSEVPSVDDPTAQELTNRYLSACGIEIFNEYIDHLDEIYSPIERSAEYNNEFETSYNIRYFKITKWVTDKKENNIEKLVNVYEVLSNEDCNIALIFNRKMDVTDVYIAVVNNLNSNNNRISDALKTRLYEAIKGNFPGSEFTCLDGKGIVPCLNNTNSYSVATATNVPGEKSEKFISQTIEKLLDGITPDCGKKEYTLILLATPVNNIEERKLHLSNLYSALSSFSQWNTSYQFTESNSTNSTATFGVNAGVSAGIQRGKTDTSSVADGTTEQSSNTVTNSTSTNESETNSETTSKSTSSTTGTTETVGDSETKGQSVGFGVEAGIGVVGAGGNYSYSGSKGHSTSSATSLSNTSSSGTAGTVAKTVGKTIGNSVANTLGKAINKTFTSATALSKSVNAGANFGANFARSSNVSVTVGKGETISQTFTNHNIKHTLGILDEEMKRYDQSTALGMWDFAAYVISEDYNTANNVAHSYLALTQGEQSYTSKTAVNLWRGDMGENSNEAKEICDYLRELRHPLFGLRPSIVDSNQEYLSYPTIVSSTACLSGKELAYSLNFPKKSVAGFPVIECAEFGRNIVTYDKIENNNSYDMGYIFHMNHEESTKVELNANSLCSHTFITGSTGSGKSNAIYKLLGESLNKGIKFLVIEPAKGEYKYVFGNEKDVNVYGTNPELTPLLRIDPFSFPKGIHVFEHLDRLTEIFSVCWPMYAAMPAVLKSAIEKSYSDCGWDLINSNNKYGENLFPSFADVARNIREIIDASEYDNENKGAYKGSLLTRLQSLSTGINSMIFSSNEIKPSTLFDENTIIDLSRVGSTETKSLIMGMIVLKLQEYRMSCNTMINSDLKHITVLEEAHNLLKNSSISSSEGSNIIGKSVEMVSNAIAEMRTYGEGFIIADQAPGLLDMSVIRNTNTKLIFRLPEQSDRDLVGKAANLNDDQITELAKLPLGVAAIYQNEWIQPVLCKTELFDIKTNVYKHNGKKLNDSTGTTLLDVLMTNNVFEASDKTKLLDLKDAVLNSNLSSVVKVRFLDYINSNTDESVENLCSLLYDLLNSKQAIELASEASDYEEWSKLMVKNINPSIKDYTNRQINLALMLVLLEQATRDSSYQRMYAEYATIYRTKGGIF